MTAMRAIVRTHFRAPARSPVAITGKERLDALDAEEVALFLTMLGYDPAALQSEQAHAREIVTSAAAILFGRSTIGPEVQVSRTVVVGRLTGVQRDNSLGDGYHSTATFQVTQSIKGELAVGSEVRLRQRSGPMPSGDIAIIPTEFQPGMSGEYLLFPSSETYRFRSRNPNAGSTPLFAAFLLPYRVVNGTAYAMGDGQQSTGFTVNSLAQAGGFQ